MNIKRIIREEMDDLDWIRETNPDLLNTALVFEPLITNEDYETVKKLIQRYEPNTDIDDIDMDEDFIHHILIGLTGYVAYGGTNSEDIDDDVIDELRQNMDWYIEHKSSIFSNPERVDGRKLFNL
jgi:hypothetical protein